MCKRMGWSHLPPTQKKREEKGQMRAIATRMSHGHRGMTLTRTKEKNLLTIKVEQLPLEIRGDSKCICECRGVSLIVPITCPIECGREEGGQGETRWAERRG